MNEVKSEERVYDGPAGPAEGKVLMEFRLLYQGPLLGASKTDTRAKHKHEIRQVFHPQLRRLWKTNHGLHRMAWQFGALASQSKHESDPSDGYPRYSDDELLAMGMARIASDWNRNGFNFIPLVTEELMLSCSIDVLFLRPEDPHLIFRQGDLDARVKTIFDSLRMPENLSETGGQGPEQDENPFFCLLSDDKLVSEVRVSTDQLLTLPGEREPKTNDSFLVIHVKLKPRQRTQYSWIFE